MTAREINQEHCISPIYLAMKSHLPSTPTMSIFLMRKGALIWGTETKTQGQFWNPL